MLTLRDVEKIRDLVERYQLSGNPFHKAVIYFEYGIEGALYLKEYSVAATLIKKNPSLINKDAVRKLKSREEIYKMLVNDFKASKEKITKSTSDTEGLEMIMNICREIEPTNGTKRMDMGFVFDIYRLYAECPFFEDYDFLTDVAFKGFMDTTEFVDNLFYKSTLHTAVFELSQTMINMAPYMGVYLDLLVALMHIFVRLYYGDDIIDRGERKVLMSEIKDSICECTTTVDTDTILKTIVYIKSMERTSKFYIDKYEYEVPSDRDEESAQMEVLDNLYSYLKEKIDDEYEDIKYDAIEIIDVVQELTHENGIRRVAVYNYIKDNILDFNVEGFYDVQREVYLLDLIEDDTNSNVSEDMDIDGNNEDLK